MLPLRGAIKSRLPLSRPCCSCARPISPKQTHWRLVPRFSSSQAAAPDIADPPRTATASTTTATTVPSPPPNFSNQVPPDHRTLGVRQELFTTSIYSPGSPIFLPNGTRIFNRLVEFLRRQYAHYGFEEVLTPTIYKKALWAKSGHLENYADDMFTVTSLSPARAATDPSVLEGDDGASGHTATTAKEDDEYGLKPMNCPGHCLIFASQKRSYRDLPVRYADFSPLHRNEVSGALSGLTRVRRFHQDDGHIFCLPSQIEDEISRTLSFVRRTYEVLKLGPYRLVLSTRPEEHFIGSLAEWDQAEAALRQALDGLGEPWTENPGDGAFYGPKIDIILRDSDGKEHQTATIQLDFQLPKRFELEYHAPTPPSPAPAALPEGTGAQGDVTSGAAAASTTSAEEPARPVLIHRAILGSVERLMALLIEHYDGKWPFWLNPRQVMIVTVNDTQPVVDRATAIRDLLIGGAATAAASQLAVDVDHSARSLPLKVREAKTKGYGAIVTIGAKEVESGVVPVDISNMPCVTLPDGSVMRRAEKPKPLKMDPEALCRMLKGAVDSYE